MLFRRAQLDDFEKIVELQHQHLLTNLQGRDLSNGFLATAFSVEQFAAMDQAMCVVVCEDGRRLCGYLGSCSIDFYQQFPVAKAMLDRLPAALYRGKPVDLSRVFVANPVCIDAEFRGRGVYLGLCRTILAYLPVQFDLAVTMVADENKRSMTATTRLGFEVVDKFEVHGKCFHTMMNDMREFRGKYFIPAAAGISDD